jgi:hypothetical protein
MAFGIDDALYTAAASISLADTIVQTVKRYRQHGVDYDFELLLGEVRNTALRKIDDADLALVQFERMLVERGVDVSMRVSDVIAKASFWNPVEQLRLRQIRKQLNEFSDAIYGAGDDIAALARCHERTREMGMSVVESTRSKHELHAKLLGARSLKEAIDLLRDRLASYKVELSK